ncbi:MAG: pyridoxamine 5'-phosphate oxidase family protein [Clostridiales bacterium]|nr:pyridoxamine 5'-phosphate oxidase family protein [Eubacteriales bacterium]MDH7566634.1 pyridoxamine 5'-phosphate oxidase family protein [Clostridiales bacterium]
MKEVYQFLKENPTFYLATVDGDEPQVRPFGVVAIIDGKFYIQTANTKKVYQQMIKNPKIAICTVGKDGRWLRISATAVEDDRMEVRQQFLDANPMLKDMYAADDGKCTVFYLKDATCTFYSFTSAPEVHNF